jgi:hypothetical protein
LRLIQLDDLLVHDGQTNAIRVLVDEDEISDLQRGNHRARRNLEWLDHERAQQEHCGNHREETGGVLQPPGLAQLVFSQLQTRGTDVATAAVLRLHLRTRIKFSQCRGRSRLTLALKHKLVSHPRNTGEDDENKQNQGEVHG